MTLVEFQKLKSDVERLQREQSRSEGALQQFYSRLEKEYGLKDCEEVRAALEELKEEEQVLAKQCHDAMHDFTEVWGEKLKGG